MKTAIVYRANPHLDANLLPLKEQVDFFVRFEPADLPSDEEDIREKVVGKLKGIGIPKTTRFFVDLTTANGVSDFATRGEDALPRDSFWSERMHIISQEAGPLEAYVRQIADEGAGVILIYENLADHVQIDGTDPYSLDDQDRKPGGWYHRKTLAIWENAFRALGVPYTVLSAHDLSVLVPDNVIVVCDHHCANQYPAAIRKKAGARWRNAFASLPPGKFTKPEDILSHCLQVVL